MFTGRASGLLTGLVNRFIVRRNPEAATQLARIDWHSLSWSFLTSWAGGSCEISPGVDIGRADWQPVLVPETARQREAEGIDNIYGDRHSLRVWLLETKGIVRIFAAVEVSNGVWLIFRPKGCL